MPLPARVDVGDTFTLDPHGFFVYVLRAEDGSPLYIGQSCNVLARLGTHLTDPSRRKMTCSVQVIRCGSRNEMRRLEAQWIREYQPPLNISGTVKTGPIPRYYELTELVPKPFPSVDWLERQLRDGTLGGLKINNKWMMSDTDVARALNALRNIPVTTSSKPITRSGRVRPQLTADELDELTSAAAQSRPILSRRGG